MCIHPTHQQRRQQTTTTKRLWLNPPCFLHFPTPMRLPGLRPGQWLHREWPHRQCVPHSRRVPARNEDLSQTSPMMSHQMWVINPMCPRSVLCPTQTLQTKTTTTTTTVTLANTNDDTTTTTTSTTTTTTTTSESKRIHRHTSAAWAPDAHRFAVPGRVKVLDRLPVRLHHSPGHVQANPSTLHGKRPSSFTPIQVCSSRPE